eukprot:5978925-Pyramimonas_sp.AAC.1
MGTTTNVDVGAATGRAQALRGQAPRIARGQAGMHHSQSTSRRVPGHGPVVARPRPPPRRPRAGRSSGIRVAGTRRGAHGRSRTTSLASS